MKNLEKIIFVHYGTNKIEKNRIRKIRNRKGWNKPSGGIWASPLNSNHSWRKFCLNEGFNVSSLDKHSLFKLRPGSKIYTINSYLDLFRLKKYFIHHPNRIFKNITIDYEKMKKDWYDGVYLTEEGEHDTRHSYYNYSIDENLDLYGWDCESIVIFNKDIIVPIKREKQIKLSNKNYKKQSIIINTQKSNNLNNPDKLEWNTITNNTIVIPGKNYKSKKAFYRDIRKILHETEDDPSRVIKLYGK